MPPRQSTEVTPDARYASLGRPGLDSGRPARPGARPGGAHARPAVPDVALGLDARPRVALDRPAAGAGGDVRPRDDDPAVVLVLAPGRPAAAPADARPRRGRAHRHLRRVRGGAAAHGSRRPRPAARAHPRGVGARRRGPPVGAPDVRGPGRPLPLPAQPPAATPRRATSTTPWRWWRPSSWSPSTPTTSPGRNCSSSASAISRIRRWRSSRGRRPSTTGASSTPATRATPSTTTRASSSTSSAAGRTATTRPSGAGAPRSSGARPWSRWAGWPRRRWWRTRTPPCGCTRPGGAPSSSRACWPWGSPRRTSRPTSSSAAAGRAGRSRCCGATRRCSRGGSPGASAWSTRRAPCTSSRGRSGSSPCRSRRSCC